MNTNFSDNHSNNNIIFLAVLGSICDGDADCNTVENSRCMDGGGDYYQCSCPYFGGFEQDGLVCRSKSLFHYIN